MPIFGVSCVRLLNEEREHKLSICACSEHEGKYDLVRPSGKVLFCGVEEELVELLVREVGLGFIDTK